MNTLRLKSLPSPLEREEQATFFAWLNYLKFHGERIAEYAYAVPNGSYLHGDIAQRAIQGNALRKQGVRAGVPDVVIAYPVAPHHGLYIEFKRIGGPQPTDEQIQWHDRLQAKGYAVFTAYGSKQAEAFTMAYFK
jgi:hypothetical protein